MNKIILNKKIKDNLIQNLKKIKKYKKIKIKSKIKAVLSPEYSMKKIDDNKVTTSNNFNNFDLKRSLFKYVKKQNIGNILTIKLPTTSSSEKSKRNLLIPSIKSIFKNNISCINE